LRIFSYVPFHAVNYRGGEVKNSLMQIFWTEDEIYLGRCVLVFAIFANGWVKNGNSLGWESL